MSGASNSEMKLRVEVNLHKSYDVWVRAVPDLIFLNPTGAIAGAGFITLLKFHKERTVKH